MYSGNTAGSTSNLNCIFCIAFRRLRIAFNLRARSVLSSLMVFFAAVGVGSAYFCCAGRLQPARFLQLPCSSDAGAYWDPFPLCCEGS